MYFSYLTISSLKGVLSTLKKIQNGYKKVELCRLRNILQAERAWYAHPVVWFLLSKLK